jgi:hypothetical protein
MKPDDDKTIDFWRKYLILIGISLISMGTYVSLFNTTPLFALFGNLIDPVFWPDEITTDGTKHFKGFIYSFSGVYVLLWGVNFLFISKYALVRGNKWAWNCLALSTILWSSIMVPFSMYYKVYYNVIGDIVFFVLIAIPLMGIRRHIFVESPQLNRKA